MKELNVAAGLGACPLSGAGGGAVEVSSADISAACLLLQSGCRRYGRGEVLHRDMVCVSSHVTAVIGD